jgi:hypothetical protein
MFPHNFLLLDAVFIGKPPKVEIMQQADDAPKFGFVAEAFFSGKVFHHPFHHLGMVKMESIIVVLGQ